MRGRPLIAGVILGGLLAAAPIAEASTVSHSGSRITYTASAGEQNHLVVSKAPAGPAGITRISLRDEGAIVIVPTTPGPFGACIPVDQHEVMCNQRDTVSEVRANLGDGDDYARIGVGFGQLFGGAGDDELHGGPATFGDTIQGGAGNDILNGGGGANDQIAYNDRSVPVTVDLQLGIGGAAGETDTLTGFEDIFGGSAGDTLKGGDTAAQYIISGGNGNDVIEGGSARVVGWGGNGDDVLTGGAGTDQLEGGNGADVIGGSGGGDTVNYYARITDVNVSLDGIANDGVRGEGDNVLPQVGAILSGHNHDAIDASAATGPMFIEGREGNDTIIGSAFADRIEGGKETDVIFGGDGDDSIHGEQPGAARASGRDEIHGGAGIDTYTTLDDDPARVGTAGVTIDLDGVADDGFPGEEDNIFDDVENIVASRYADHVTGSAAVNVLTGLGGNDTLLGGDADDTLSGGEGDDTLDGQAGADTIECGPGVDVVIPDLLDALSGDCP
ncbi:MAG TPA: calcium-binding protein [Thermoleophilaceae bacterium]|nr:calcium-binding protein [Thermoleophilaceae bacterium]